METLRGEIKAGLDSGPGIPADRAFAELRARYVECEDAKLNAIADARQGKGRSPRELVRLAAAGDEDARCLWLEFFAATSGKARHP